MLVISPLRVLTLHVELDTLLDGAAGDAGVTCLASQCLLIVGNLQSQRHGPDCDVRAVQVLWGGEEWGCELKVAVLQ